MMNNDKHQATTAAGIKVDEIFLDANGMMVLSGDLLAAVSGGMMAEEACTCACCKPPAGGGGGGSTNGSCG